MPTIIAIHGPPAVGKSTITAELRKKLKNCAYVDRPNIKRGLKPIGRPISKKLSKKTSIAILKELIKLKKDVIVEEIAAADIKKKLKFALWWHDYKVHGFYLQCSVREAIERDKHRKKKPRANLVRKIHKEYPTLSEHETMINTEKTSIKESVKLILKSIR